MPADANPHLQNTRHLLAYASLALGLQAIQASNSAFLAPLLESLGCNPFWISVILSLDPLTCILVVPLISRWSDLTTSRWGRRLPFILAGVLLATLSLLGIAMASRPAQIALAMVLLYTGTSAVWGPYRATLGEIVPTEKHTAATGLQGLCQGIGTLAGMGGGGLLLVGGLGRPYFLAAGLVLVSGAITMATIRRATAHAPKPQRPATSFLAFFRQTRDLHWLLAAQTCWWAAMSGVIGFIVLFITHDLMGLDQVTGTVRAAANQQAVGVLVLFAVVGMVASVPVGRLSTRHGRARVMRVCLLVLALGFGVGALATDLNALRVSLCLAGLGFAGIQVIPTTLFAEMQPPGHEGSVMSLLGLFTDGPLMIGFLLQGWLITATGSYRVPFISGIVFTLLAWQCIGRLKTVGHGLPVAEV